MHWFAPLEIHVGSLFGKSVVEELDDCCAALLVSSGRRNEIDHIRRDVTAAGEGSMPNIPLRIGGGANPLRRLKIRLENFFRIDALTYQAHSPDELVSTVGRIDLAQ